MKRLDGVEIKVTVEAGDVDRALEVLDLDDEQPMRIWFYEDTTTGAGPLPLLAAGLAVRLRVRSATKGDCTVKLRPCRASQLGDRWLALEEDGALEMRVEEDWAGERRVLAASLEVSLDEAMIASAPEEGEPSSGLLSEDQRAYLAECSAFPLNVTQLRRLGPIKATRWDVDGGPLGDLGVRAERWEVADLDLLEFSVKVDADDALETQRQLVAELQRFGLSAPAEQETKTRRVLAALSGV